MKKRLMALAATLALLVPANAAHAEEGVGLWTVGHVQGIGWMDPSTEMVGTTGLGLRLEAIDFGEYPVAEARGHVQNIG